MTPSLEFNLIWLLAPLAGLAWRALLIAIGDDIDDLIKSLKVLMQ